MTNDDLADDSVVGDLSPSQYRRALGRFPTTAVLISAMIDGNPLGAVIGTFALASVDPPLVGFFADSQVEPLARVLAAKRWSFSVLRQEDLSTLGAFHGAQAPQFEGLAWRLLPSGAPHLRDTLLTVVAEPHSMVRAGDREAIIARVLDVQLGDPSARPLIIQSGRLGRLDPGQLLDRELCQLDLT